MGCTNSQSIDNNATKPVLQSQVQINHNGKKMVWRLQEEQEQQYSNAERMIIDDPLAGVDENPQVTYNNEPITVEQQLQNLVKSFFDKYDEDKSGELDFRQFTKFFNHTGFGQRLTDKQLQSLMGQADTTNNQKISQKQMCELLRKVLKF